eukprot:876497_1
MQTKAGCIRNTVSITTLLIWQKLCTKMRCVIANHACCQCTEYKEPIPTNRSLPTGHYMGTAQAHIEMVLFKNPNYCFDEESLLLLFGDILKYFGYMSKDYNLKQCLLTVDAAKECLISMGTGKGAQRIVLQQMQSIISSLMLIKNGKLSNQQLLRKIMPQSNRQCKKVCLTSVS